MLSTRSVVTAMPVPGIFKAGDLGFPERRQAALAVAGEGRDLDEVEGEVVAPDLPPALDEGLHLVAVFQAAAFTLASP